MVKVNGWKRIGIIASVVWILGAWIHTFNSVTDSASEAMASIQVRCDSNLAGKTGGAWDEGFNECNKQANESLAKANKDARLWATLVAFVPVPLGWGFTYLILFQVGWVRRGFMQPL